jgi:peptidoglycan/LPS O-acetylase OafA/YrhL
MGPWRAVLIVLGVALFWRTAVPALTQLAFVCKLPFYWWFEWSLGFLVADLRDQGKRVFSRPKLFAALLLPTALYCVKFPPHWSLPFLLTPVAFVALLEAACVSSRPLNLAERLLCSLGISSYSLYLVHSPVIWFAQYLLRDIAYGFPPALIWIGVFSVAFVIMQIIAWAMFRYIEEPSIALGQICGRRLTWVTRKFKLPVAVAPS